MRFHTVGSPVMLRPFDPNLPVSLLPPVSGDKNADAALLLDFITRLFYLHMPDSFYAQLWASMGLIMSLTIPATFIVFRRIFQHRAWILKILPVASGTFVIPNSVMAFLLCQGVFAFAWTSYAYVTIRYYRNHALRRGIFLWKTLTWLPLWDGAWWAAFGVLSAFPEALTFKNKGVRQKKRLILSPSVFNVACWFTPVLQLASLLPPAVLAARKHNQAFDAFEAWRNRVEVAQNGRVSDATYATLRSDALGIWSDVTKAYWYFAIAMTCWDIWAIVCLCVHVPVGAHTLSRIKAQLVAARIEERDILPEIQISPVEDAKDDTWTSKHSQRAASPGITSGHVLPLYRAPASRTAQQRKVRNLEKVHRNLSIQYYAVSIAILLFLTCASVYVISAYDSARNNTIPAIQIEVNLTAAWVIFVFGSLTVFCIFQRSFDPALSVDVSERRPSIAASRSIFVAFKQCTVSLGSLGRSAGSECPGSCASAGEMRVTRGESTSPTQRAESAGVLLDAHAERAPSGIARHSRHNSEKVDHHRSHGSKAQGIASKPPTEHEGGTPTHAHAGNREAVTEVYYATPHGKVPAATCTQVRCTSGTGRARSKSLTPQQAVCGVAFEELDDVHTDRNELERRSSMRKSSASSIGQWHLTRSPSSISMASTFATTPSPDTFGKSHGSDAPEALQMSRTMSTPELAGSALTSISGSSTGSSPSSRSRRCTWPSSPTPGPGSPAPAWPTRWPRPCSPGGGRPSCGTSGSP